MSDPEPADPHRAQPSTDRKLGAGRYFFDVQDGDAVTPDHTGLDLTDPDAIPREAYGLLRNLMHDRLPDGTRELTVRVRDEGGAVVYVGEMAIVGRRHRP